MVRRKCNEMIRQKGTEIKEGERERAREREKVCPGLRTKTADGMPTTLSE